MGKASRNANRAARKARATEEAPRARRQPPPEPRTASSSRPLRARAAGPDPLRAGPDEPPDRVLARAVRYRDRNELRVREAVDACRAQGMTWASIGKILGTTGQAAGQRYGAASGGAQKSE